MKQLIRPFARAILASLLMAALHSCHNDSSHSTLSLTEFDKDRYPAQEDLWIIDDHSADRDDFAGLSRAIEALCDCDREISLEFSELTSIPDFAIFGRKLFVENFAGDCLHAISASKATRVGVSAFAYCAELHQVELSCAAIIDQAAFFNCNSLECIELPCTTTLGEYTFAQCHNLRQISIATVDGAILESIANNAFYDTPTEEITLYIGAANSKHIDGGYLKVGNRKWKFKKIVVI